MKIYYIIFLLLLFGMTGCKKFLDVKPNESLVQPKDNLENLQLLLNSTTIMNQQVPSAGEIGTDNAFLSDVQWQKLLSGSATSANLYIWSRDVFNEANASDLNDWVNAYNVVFNANIVLDAIDETAGGINTTTGNNLRGQALFFRAFSFYHLLQDFAKPYNPNTSNTDRGIVLRLTSNVSDKFQRSTVLESYNQVTTDLAQAADLLPTVALYKTNPCKAAAIGLLARTYLAMSDYGNALKYAKQYLALSPDLIDFNTLSTTAAYPIARYSKEVVFHAKLFNMGAYSTNYARVSDALYAMYDTNDLRRVCFFSNGGTGNVSFKGSYYGNSSLFAGISTDEIYLIRAECYARANQTKEAMADLNTLMKVRWSNKVVFPSFTATDANDALRQILTERRKELIFRNLRWGDLKRLNQDVNTQVTINRVVNGDQYVLSPNDSHYELAIPQKVIQLSGIQQN